MSRPSAAALWASVAETLRTAILPALAGDTHARSAAVQLVGLARYACTRSDDPTPGRRAQLDATLTALRGNPLVPDAGSPAARAGAALTAAVGRNDADAVAVRRALRPILIEHLDADLAETAVLGDVFRGRLPDA